MSKGKLAHGYLAASRRLAASYVFVAPLFAVYQLGVALDARSRNGADPLFREIFDALGHFGFVVLNLLLLGLLFLAIWRTKAKRLRVRGLYWYMLVESTLWACVLLAVAFALPPEVFPDKKPLALPGLARNIVASTGAGVYEETIFRFLLMGGTIFVFKNLLGGHLAWVVPVAILASAALFSLAHHEIGGEVWSWPVFYFRGMMGVLLGILYWYRGLGVVVWVHALYNIALVSSNG